MTDEQKNFEDVSRILWLRTKGSSMMWELVAAQFYGIQQYALFRGDIGEQAKFLKEIARVRADMEA